MLCPGGTGVTPASKNPAVMITLARKTAPLAVTRQQRRNRNLNQIRFFFFLVLLLPSPGSCCRPFSRPPGRGRPEMAAGAGQDGGGRAVLLHGGTRPRALPGPGAASAARSHRGEKRFSFVCESVLFYMSCGKIKYFALCASRRC